MKKPDEMANYLYSWMLDINKGFHVDKEVIKRAAYICAIQLALQDSKKLFFKHHNYWEKVKGAIKNLK